MRDDVAITRWALAAGLLCCFLATAVRASADGAMLTWQGAGGIRAAPHLSTDVEFTVSGVVARVRLTQRFRNDSADWVEGVYTFPLPDTAAVDGLRMRYGETLIVGEVREKQQAARSYAAAKAAGRRTVLVDRQRPNLFTTRLANVGPGDVVEIELSWQQVAGYDDGRFALRLPMTFTPRYVPGEPVAPGPPTDGWAADTDQVPDASAITPPVVATPTASGHRFTLSGVIDAGMALDSVESRYHPLRTTPLGGAWRVELEAGSALMDHDVELTWRTVEGAGPAVAIFRGDVVAGGETLLLLFHPPHADDAGMTPPPREVIFVIDTSGSMQGDSMTYAKEALGLALARLRPTDRFNVIEFDDRTTAFYPAPVPADDANKSDAARRIARLEAGGGTEMAPALAAALARPSRDGTLRQIVFVTDGSVGNEAALLRMISERLGDSRLFTVAIGSAPNGWFMRKAAEAGRGSHITVSAGREVAIRMERLFRRLERPALTDIRIDWPDGLGVDAYPATIPDLYAGEPVLVAARLDRWPSPGALITVSGSRGDGYWSRQLVPDDAGRYPGVAKLWARARIEALEDAARSVGEPDRHRGEILDTALGYGLVTSLTSLVAVDRSPARPAGTPLDRRRVASLLPRGQSAQAIFGLPATGTSAPRSRLIGLALLLGGLLLLIVLRVEGLRRCHAA